MAPTQQQRPETCLVRALQAWLEGAGIESGPLFGGVNRHGQLLAGRRSDRAVARVVQRQADAAGLENSRSGVILSGLGWRPVPQQPAPPSGRS
jgi:hypothetical protein